MLFLYYYYGPSKRAHNNSGGEGGIRTLEGLLTLTPLAGERFQPLSHLSDRSKILAVIRPCEGRTSY